MGVARANDFNDEVAVLTNKYSIFLSKQDGLS